MIGRVLPGPLALMGGVLVLVATACGSGEQPQVAAPPGGRLPSSSATATPTATLGAPAPTATATLPASITPQATLSAPVALETAQAPVPTLMPTPRATGGEVGNQAPAFSLTLADGTTATVGSLVTPGKSLLLYFFATW